jgi:hypothetical protein
VVVAVKEVLKWKRGSSERKRTEKQVEDIFAFSSRGRQGRRNTTIASEAAAGC